MICKSGKIRTSVVRKSFLILMKAVSIMIKLQIDIKAERERTLSKT